MMQAETEIIASRFGFSEWVLAALGYRLRPEAVDSELDRLASLE
jgi:hypothetical protein